MIALLVGEDDDDKDDDDDHAADDDVVGQGKCMYGGEHRTCGR